MVEKREKCCTGCKKELSLNLFYKNKTNEDGKSIYCKACTKLNAKKYYQQKLLKQASQSNGFQIKDVIFPTNFVSLDSKRADVALKIALIQRLMLTVSTELRELAESLSQEKMGV
jgi:hypothetical protein